MPAEEGGEQMTDSDEKWVPIPGYPFYEASDQGRIRSIDRTVDGRPYRGTVLSSRISNSGYVLVDVRDADGAKQTRTAHTLVLWAFRGHRPRGMEARHLNGEPTDNRLENLEWGTKAENTEDQFRHGRARAEPKAKVCVRCGDGFTTPGRRCHPCVAELGEHAARLLAGGVALDEACRTLDYPSETGLLTLACKYGALRLVLGPPLPSQIVTLPAPARVTLRDRLRWLRR